MAKNLKMTGHGLTEGIEIEHKIDDVMDEIFHESIGDGVEQIVTMTAKISNQHIRTAAKTNKIGH